MGDLRALSQVGLACVTLWDRGLEDGWRQTDGFFISTLSVLCLETTEFLPAYCHQATTSIVSSDPD